ncbi:MAG: class I SAM-dependent methyltransferase [Alphaproteobacteria bacterium]
MGPDDEAPTPGDAEALKAAVRDGWQKKSGAWNRWADHIAELAERLNAPLLDAAELAPGQAVLDLASGAGEPALSIARRIALGGTVTATDLVPDMLAGAKRRAAAAGLENLRFEIADMEALPFADAAFDRVVCRFGIMFCPRAHAALAEARRVLKPGGRAAFLVWGPRADNTMFEVVQTIAPDFVDATPFTAELTPFRFGEAGALAAALADAGFADVEERVLRFTPTPPAGSRFWQHNLEMSFGTALEALAPARRAALDAALDEAFARYLDGDVYRIAAHARIGVGDSP